MDYLRTHAGTTPRPLPWVASILYVAVLAAGVYFAVTGHCAGESMPVRTMGFVGVLGFLIALEVLERQRFGARTPRRVAVALLALRLLLFWVVGTLDCAGFSRVLYVLIPFLAYFSLGRRASYALAVFLVGALVVSLSVRVPSWYADQEQVSDLLMFCVGVVMAVSMAAVAAEEEASRTRAERLLGQVAELATATERNRMARDIHDSLGHHLTVIAVQLEKAAAFRERDPAAADQALADARRSTRHALDDVRQSVGALRDPGAGFALSAAMRALVGRMNDGPFTVELDIVGEEAGFAGPELLALYRAAQEGLTNASRHAAATSVTVRIVLDEGGASLLVADDGRGFDLAEPPGPGFGLRGMGERLQLIGGSLTVDSGPGRGTRLLAQIPRRETTPRDAAAAAAKVTTERAHAGGPLSRRQGAVEHQRTMSRNSKPWRRDRGGAQSRGRDAV